MSDIFTLWQVPIACAFIYNPADGSDLVTQKINTICTNSGGDSLGQFYTAVVNDDGTVTVTDAYGNPQGDYSPGDWIYSTWGTPRDDGPQCPQGYITIAPYTPPGP